MTLLADVCGKYSVLISCIDLYATDLVEACRKGNLELDQKLIAEGADVNHDVSGFFFYYHNTGRLTQTSHTHVQEKSRHCDIDTMYWTPLGAAIFNGHIAIVRMLLNNPKVNLQKKFYGATYVC